MDENINTTIAGPEPVEIPSEVVAKQAMDDEEYIIDRIENAEHWVSDFLDRKSYAILPNTDISGPIRRHRSTEIFREVLLKYDIEFKQIVRRTGKKNAPLRVSDQLLGYGFEKLVDDKWHCYLSEKKKEVSFNPELNFGELERFIIACTGRNRKLDVMVMAQFMWQVKRKMFGLRVADHIMPILIGKQGVGKSSAVNTLLTPLEDYRSEMSISALADERNYHSLEKTFVIVCDEMQGCARADIDQLKNMITATNVTARKLYTNIRDRIPQNASFIGTSNKMLELIIRDDTGMRRFFPINCENIDWAVIRSCDPKKMWLAIDENIAGGYLSEVMKELRAEQETSRFKNSVELYLEETNGLGVGSLKIPVDDVFRDYVAWCECGKFDPMNKNTFSKLAYALGVGAQRDSSMRYLVLSDNYRSQYEAVRDQLRGTAQRIIKDKNGSTIIEPKIVSKD